jgi:hypothetical protein
MPRKLVMSIARKPLDLLRLLVVGGNWGWRMLGEFRFLLMEWMGIGEGKQ